MEISDDAKMIKLSHCLCLSFESLNSRRAKIYSVFKISRFLVAHCTANSSIPRGTTTSSKHINISTHSMLPFDNTKRFTSCFSIKCSSSPNISRIIHGELL
ncbi:hypothetical protein Tcan_00660, partial [Toxocara canis]